MLPIEVKSKYFETKTRTWKEIYYKIDKHLSYDYSKSTWVTIDGEFTGLYPQRDKDVLWTIASDDENGNLRIEMLYTFEGDADLSKLKEILQSDKEKYFYYGQMDIAHLYKMTGIKIAQPIFDIKVASKVIRTYTGEHTIDGLMKSLCGVTEELVNKREMGKSKEFGIHPSEWSPELHQYNVNDVAYLKDIAEALKKMAKRLEREDVLNAVHIALPELAVLYANGYYRDVFIHSYNDTDMASAPMLPRFGGK